RRINQKDEMRRWLHGSARAGVRRFAVPRFAPGGRGHGMPCPYGRPRQKLRKGGVDELEGCGVPEENPQAR
ncbi:MAG: hypothetical protein ACRD41_16380, partial [Candidatus Acidiferrales bacterium]